MVTSDVSGASRATRRTRRRRAVLMAVITAGIIGVLAISGGSTLTESATTFGHLDWRWVPLAIVAEASSMAAFARTQRRLLRVGGTNLHLRSAMAVTYAGNAISVSLPLAGPEAATGFVYRRYGRLGIDEAVVAWALAVSGMFSSLAFALVLLGGAAASPNMTGTTLGLVGAAIALLPSVTVLAALRYDAARRSVNRSLARGIGVSRKLVNRPGPDAAHAVERFLDRVATLRLTRLQYTEVLALAVWNWTADCLCLAFAIRATGTNIPWHGLLLAYSAGMGVASIGLTPGGLGVVEAALAATLVAAGIKYHSALTAVLVYRLVSFWLVMTAGWAILAILSRNRGPRPNLHTDP